MPTRDPPAPSLGDPCSYYFAVGERPERTPRHSFVTNVHDDGTVSLAVFELSGTAVNRTNVPLLSKNDAPPDSEYCVLSIGGGPAR